MSEIAGVDRNFVKAAMSVPSRERRLVEKACMLDALGMHLGIPKERVRQIETRALEKPRPALLIRHPQGAAALIEAARLLRHDLVALAGRERLGVLKSVQDQE